MSCPDPKLCERLNRHVHGKMYELYQNDERYRKILEGDLQEPSLIQKAINFAGALTNHISSGMKNVSDEELERRINICKSCEFFNPANESCTKCGCRMSIKASWQESVCPLNKWSLPIVS